MPLPDPEGLLAAARLLSDSSVAPPSDAQLRRAVYTAYYALFHSILRAAAERFMGPDKEHSPGYRLLYRSFSHSHMRDVCEKLDRPTLGDSLKRHLGRDAVSQATRDFAGFFAVLQELRNLADYDPQTALLSSDVASLVASADLAITAFRSADADEQADVLALLMVKARND